MRETNFIYRDRMKMKLHLMLMNKPIALLNFPKLYNIHNSLSHIKFDYKISLNFQ